MQPNLDNIETWIAALRSGNYKQGICGLRTADDEGGGDKFCCLGVACDLYDASLWSRSTHGLQAFQYKGRSGFLPPSVAAWLGIEQEDPLIDMDGDCAGDLRASQANDSGASFDEIAHAIARRFKLESEYEEADDVPTAA